MASVVVVAGTRLLNLVFSGVLLKAEWTPAGCTIIYTNNKILAASFIYGMAFDFLVLCLTGWKLAFPSGGRSRLITLIFGDGLIYFLVASVVYHPAPLEPALTTQQVLVQPSRNHLHAT
jgi:predicted membrane channel-forming protein YqfA (hemolysin III family)